jgi:hypothetical protein
MADPKIEKIENQLEGAEVNKQDSSKQESELSSTQMDKIAGGGLVVGTL